MRTCLSGSHSKYLTPHIIYISSLPVGVASGRELLRVFVLENECICAGNGRIQSIIGSVTESLESSYEPHHRKDIDSHYIQLK
jgi:hypothetical protein